MFAIESPTTTGRLAVCSWSLEPHNPLDLATKLHATGIHRVQLALDPLRTAPAIWGDVGELFQQQGITIVSGMFGCVGEDYSTLESIRRTGGIAPDGTWEQNLENIQSTVALAKALNLKLVTFHAGFLPHYPTDPGFETMARRLEHVATIFAKDGICVALETGQETAVALAALLEMLNRPNLGVNFDPANMILYGKGAPVKALQILGSHIRQVHIKDANRAQTPGAWGEEVPVGTGEVDWRAFFDTLKRLNYAGNFVIEREAGTQRVADIRTAAEVFNIMNR